MFGQIDFEDAIAGGLFTLASLVSTGIIAVTFLPNGIQLSSAVWTVQGTNIRFSFLIALSMLGLAYGTNRVDGGQKNVRIDSDLADILWMSASAETYMLIATLLVVVFNGLNILGVHAMITGSLIAGLIVFGVQIGGYYVVSYLG